MPPHGSHCCPLSPTTVPMGPTLVPTGPSIVPELPPLSPQLPPLSLTSHCGHPEGSRCHHLPGCHRGSHRCHHGSHHGSCCCPRPPTAVTPGPTTVPKGDPTATTCLGAPTGPAATAAPATSSRPQQIQRVLLGGGGGRGVARGRGQGTGGTQPFGGTGCRPAWGHVTCCQHGAKGGSPALPQPPAP